MSAARIIESLEDQGASIGPALDAYEAIKRRRDAVPYSRLTGVERRLVRHWIGDDRRDMDRVLDAIDRADR